LYFSKQLTISNYEFSYPLNPLITDIEFENMDFLELTSSEELLLFEAVSNVSSDVPIVQSEPTRTVVNTTNSVNDLCCISVFVFLFVCF
jgi:uncharacterized protein YqgV (UPF0045/DUF77 family)